MLLALAGAIPAYAAITPAAKPGKPEKLELTFSLEHNERRLDRGPELIPFEKVSEFRAGARDGLYVEVLPAKGEGDSVQLSFTIGEIIAGRKVVRQSPRMVVENGRLAAIAVRETIGSVLQLSTKVRY